jgi:hypothetical protein
MDISLDKFREITARQSGAITLKEKSVLLGVYLDIEEYLTTKEPLLKITREDLRISLPDNFNQDLKEYETNNKIKRSRVII